MSRQARRRTKIACVTAAYHRLLSPRDPAATRATPLGSFRRARPAVTVTAGAARAARAARPSRAAAGRRRVPICARRRMRRLWHAGPRHASGGGRAAGGVSAYAAAQRTRGAPHRPACHTATTSACACAFCACVHRHETYRRRERRWLPARACGGVRARRRRRTPTRRPRCWRLHRDCSRRPRCNVPSPAPLQRVAPALQRVAPALQRVVTALQRVGTALQHVAPTRALQPTATMPPKRSTSAA